MDFENAGQFAREMAAIDERIATREPALTATSKELAPSDRFENLWGRIDRLLNTEREHSGGMIEAQGRTEEGTPLTVSLELKTEHAPAGSLGPTKRIINAEWAWFDATGCQEAIGEPEEINDVQAALLPDDPTMLRSLGLLEESVTAAEELISVSPTAPRPHLYSTRKI